MPIGRPLTASAHKVTFSKDGLRRITEPPWVDRAWTAYDRLPELHFGINTRQNIANRFDFFPAYLPDPTSEPERLEDGPAVAWLENEGGAALLRRLATALVIHFDVAGLAYLVSVDEDGRRLWDIYSTQELRKSGDQYRPTDSVGNILASEKAINQDDVYVVWRPHPRDRTQADSPLRSSLEVAELLILSGREMQARSMSRLGAGVWMLPESMDLGGDEETDEGDPVESFQQRITDILTHPIGDPGAASAIVPFIMQAHRDDIKAAKDGLITFERDWEASRDDREELIRRLANGMDLPPEILLGMAAVNHWASWLVSENAVTMHVDPTVRVILDSLTTGWFRPALVEAGIDPAGIVLWRDTTPAIVPADRTEQHMAALAAGLIGFDATRERLGYDPNEAPTPEELALIGLLGGGVPTVGGEVRGPAQTDRPGSGGNGSTPSLQGGEFDIATAARTIQQIYLGVNVVLSDEEARAMVTAAGFPLPDSLPTSALTAALPAPDTADLDELTDLDDAALEYTLSQCQAAIDRALEKAGARLRSQVQAKPELAALVNGVPNTRLADVLAGKFAPTDVVDPKDFDSVLDRIVARWRRTATAAGAFLARLFGVDPETATLEQDLVAGQNRLRDVLTEAVTAALFTPDALPDPADVGEVLDRRLPVSEIRGAMSVAGGGEAVYSDGATHELIANGYRTDQTLRKAAAASLSFTWRYGDPASRAINFEPHRNLNGVSFGSWTDDRLTISGASWVGGTHFRPGDHRGCQCSYVRTVTVNAEAIAAAAL